jgi:hypothetical protein
MYLQERVANIFGNIIVYQFALSIIILTFETFVLPVTGRSDIAASLVDTMPVHNLFLHLRTHKIPYQTHKLLSIQ